MNLFQNKVNEVGSLLALRIERPPSFRDEYKKMLLIEERKRLKIIGEILYNNPSMKNYDGYLTKGLLSSSSSYTSLLGGANSASFSPTTTPNDDSKSGLIEQFGKSYPQYDVKKDPDGFIKNMMKLFSELEKVEKMDYKTNEEKKELISTMHKKIEQLQADIEKSLGPPGGEEKEEEEVTKESGSDEELGDDASGSSTTILDADAVSGSLSTPEAAADTIAGMLE
jgi:hypothetical protein